MYLLIYTMLVQACAMPDYLGWGSCALGSCRGALIIAKLEMHCQQNPNGNKRYVRQQVVAEGRHSITAALSTDM